jgi:prolyl oligopeptidase
MPGSLDYPVARKVDVVDDYHGTKVADPYRWLEDPSSPGYREWIDAENTLTERVLSTIPDRAATQGTADRALGLRALRGPGPRGQPRLLPSATAGCSLSRSSTSSTCPGSSRGPLLDPNTLSKDGTVAVTGTVPSREAKPPRLRNRPRPAATGQEWRVRKVDTGEDMPDRISG